MAGTAWLQRSDERLVVLDPAGPYRLSSSAGPIEVSTGPAPQLSYAASWLVTGPSVSTGLSDGEFHCPTRLPCRATARIEVPVSSELAVYGDGQDIFVDRFDGFLTATSVGEADVVLGPVGGSVVIRTESGRIFGHGLTAEDVAITSQSGSVNLSFAEPPVRLMIANGEEPVNIRLPDVEYAVSVVGASSVVVNLSLATTGRLVANGESGRRVVIETTGPVRIDPIE